MSQKRLPRVVIVGRPNVGKSSLLNALAGRKVSIVDPTAGVTRDRIATIVKLPPVTRQGPAVPVEVVDTGGYGIEDAAGAELSAAVQRQIAAGLAGADVVLFVVDAQAGVMPLDREVAQLLRHAGGGGAASPTVGRVVLVANKVDAPVHEADAYEAAALGFGEPVMVSATTRYQLSQLHEALHDRLADVAIPAGSDHVAVAGPDDEAGSAEVTGVGPAEPEDLADLEALDDGTEPEMQLAVVGKRNAGKSTLVNALAGDDRVIVSELEGTTRDAIDVRFEMEGHHFLAIDTAGLRKRKAITTDLDYYSMHRALRSIRRADVVLLLLDATVPVSQVDRKLAHEVQKHFKPVIVVVNKWDLVGEEHAREEYVEYLDETMKGLSFAPVAFISAREGEGLRDLVAMALNLHQQAGHRVATGEMNRVMEQVLAERTPHSGVGRRPRIYYATQLAIRPPTIGLFVNDPELFDATYERFLINRLRDELPFAEVPIKLLIRGRDHAPKRSA
jgi:GTP-binding protein